MSPLKIQLTSPLRLPQGEGQERPVNSISLYFLKKAEHIFEI